MNRIAALSVLLCCLVAASVADAAHTRRPTASPRAAVVRDCVDGRLDHRHSSAALRSALRTLPADIDDYTNCRDAIASQRAIHVGTRGGPTVGAILRDCTTHGRLRHRYPAVQLRRALRHLRAGGAGRYATCGDLVVSQLRGWRSAA
jgi:hypothetical protein